MRVALVSTGAPEDHWRRNHRFFEPLYRARWTLLRAHTPLTSEAPHLRAAGSRDVASERRRQLLVEDGGVTGDAQPAHSCGVRWRSGRGHGGQGRAIAISGRES